jgi:hypothetical protein
MLRMSRAAGQFIAASAPFTCQPALRIFEDDRGFLRDIFRKQIDVMAQPRAGFARFDFCRRAFGLVGCSALSGPLPRDVRRYDRNARFTLAPSENASATSGSSNTIVVPAVARA